jgi:hypothetical protein
LSTTVTRRKWCDPSVAPLGGTLQRNIIYDSPAEGKTSLIVCNKALVS